MRILKTLIGQVAYSSPVHDLEQKPCMKRMKEQGRRTGPASSPFVCDYLGVIHRGLHLFFFPHCFTPLLKKNGYCCTWNTGGLDFENSNGRSRNVSLWDGIRPGSRSHSRRVRDNKESLYPVSGLIYNWIRLISSQCIPKKSVLSLPLLAAWSCILCLSFLHNFPSLANLLHRFDFAVYLSQ
jgi:hypothetical protein